MKYCPRCGVIFEDDVERCPLCDDPGAPYAGESVPAYPSPEKATPAALPPEALTRDERGRIALELLTVAFGIALAVSLLADLFSARSFTWSRYSSVVLVGAWLFSAMPLIFRRRSWLSFAVLAPSLVLMVFLVDVFDGRITWFPSYGLPLALAAVAGVAGAGAIIAAMRRKGLNVIAVVLSFAALFCFGVEVILDLHSRFALTWSVVVAFALLPSAGILFYLHYRIVHRASLRKLFRL